MPPRTDKRQAILDAALELFAERGFHGTSVPEMAKRAGVGAGTIYRNFENKEAVVNALYQHWKAQTGAALLNSVDPKASWRAQFRSLWRALMDFDRQHPHVLEFIDLQHHSDYLDEKSLQIEAASGAAFFAFVLSAQADEAIVQADPAVIVAMVYGAFVGLLRGVRTGYFQLTPELVEMTEERVWSMVRN